MSDFSCSKTKEVAVHGSSKSYLECEQAPQEEGEASRRLAAFLREVAVHQVEGRTVVGSVVARSFFL